MIPKGMVSLSLEAMVKFTFFLKHNQVSHTCRKTEGVNQVQPNSPNGQYRRVPIYSSCHQTSCPVKEHLDPGNFLQNSAWVDIPTLSCKSQLSGGLQRHVLSSLQSQLTGTPTASFLRWQAIGWEETVILSFVVSLIIHGEMTPWCRRVTKPHDTLPWLQLWAPAKLQTCAAGLGDKVDDPEQPAAF